MLICTLFLTHSSQTKIGDLPRNLEKHVVYLAQKIGERNILFYDQLEAAANYIVEQLESFGYHHEMQSYIYQGMNFRNIIATQKRTDAPEEEIIIGAHYDSALGTPGADDNASGVAVLLELAKLFQKKGKGRTLKFIAFTNEEPPFFFKTPNMGSRVYTRKAKEKREKIIAALCFEMVGDGWFLHQREGFSKVSSSFL